MSLKFSVINMLIAVLFLVPLSNAMAQSAELFIDSSTPYTLNASASELQLESSIGLFTETLSTTNTILTQGFHQPTVTVTVIGVKNSNELLEVTAYPNPTTQQIFLTYNNYNPNSEIELLVYDAKGASQFIGYTLAPDHINLNLSNLAEGIYQVNLMDKSSGTTTQLSVIKH